MHLDKLDELGKRLTEQLDELVTARYLSPEYTANGDAHQDLVEASKGRPGRSTAEPKPVERKPAATVRADGPSADRFEGKTTSPFARKPRANGAGQKQGQAPNAQAPQKEGGEGSVSNDTRKARGSHPARPHDGLIDSPSELLHVNSAAAVELLEKLDDCVFDAISGDDRALAEVVRLWPEVVSAVGPDMLDESREQYLRYSLSIWESCLAEGLREPARAVASLQVLNVLFGGQESANS